MLTLKDIVAINTEFHEGKLVDPGSLDFALAYAKRTTNWAKALAYLVRAILIDHVFEDGNKRTAAALILLGAYTNGRTADKDRVARLVVRALKRNVTSIKAYEEMIKDAIA